MRFYFNPITALLEPIGFDAHLHEEENVVPNAFEEPIISAILEGDPIMKSVFRKTVERLVREIEEKKTQKWFHLQKRYIEKYTTGPYRILCGAYNVHLPKGCKNYNIGDISDSPDSHYIQVNFLADQVLLPQIEDDDIFLFLDCDAFPCHEGWDLEIKKYLESHDIVAVYRKEDVGMDEDYENIPHLCFFATTKKTWIENKLQWSLGFKEKEFDIDGKKHKRYIPKFENPQVGMKERIENEELENVIGKKWIGHQIELKWNNN